jgi:spore germination cell wall hydrolase CwlJ-like protein
LVFKKYDYSKELFTLLTVISIYIVQFYKDTRPPQIIYVDRPIIQTVQTTANVVAQAQLNCMAEAIYYEARNQSEAGQKAVGHVIMNRTKDDDYPKTVCAVVHQKINQICQFSYFCERHYGAFDTNAWNTALVISKIVISGEKDFTHGALFYHANYVKPRWRKNVTRLASIGDHIFYIKRS